MDNGEENRLKQFRIHMNMTQQQMADLLKVGQNTYSRIENGVTAFFVMNRFKQAEIAINRVADYINNPSKYKEYIEMKADIMLMKI